MAGMLIVYYSLEGNVDFVARELAKELGADLCRLETQKQYPKKGLLKFFHGGKDTVAGIKPALKTAIPDLGAYGTLVVGAPVWAGKPAAPINSFFAAADLAGKKVAVFASSAGGNASRTLELMGEAVTGAGASLLCSESFVNPVSCPDKALVTIKAFAEKLR